MRIKSLDLLRQEAAESGENSLKRSLGAFNLVAIGIGVIIGAGLFSLTGIAAANHAGPAVTLSFVVAAVGCAFSALCYAEFAAMVPVSGSAYTYAYATLGELFAWIIGWDLVLEYSVGAATVAISWSQYLNRFLSNYGLHLPPQLILSPFETATGADGSVVSGYINLPAVLIVVFITGIIIRGTSGSALFNAIVVSLKVLVVIVFIALGWQYIDPANYQPYIPANTGTFGEYGWSGVLRGAGVVFFVFIGFDIVATMAQESKNPQRDMPIGIIGSLVVCTILFVLFGYVMTGMANYTEFRNSAAPVAIAIEKTPYRWLGQLIIGAILVGYTSVILVDLLGQSRPGRRCGVFHHEPRWIIAVGFLGGTSALSFALEIEPAAVRVHWPVCRLRADSGRGRDDQHWHVAGLRDGLSRRVDFTKKTARCAPRLPHALGAGRASSGYPDLFGDDGFAARRYVAETGGLAGDWAGHLFHLWPETE